MQKLILASKSPRRKQLLEWAEIPFEIISKDTSESYPPDLPMPDIALYIARNKALEVKFSLVMQNRDLFLTPILAADTIVVLDEEIIGKPTDKNNAVTILQKLSGRKHLVITGICIIYDEKEILFTETTDVEFYKLTADQIEFYVDKYQPYDKAGAYAIQEWLGVIGIRAIEGDYYNVMGLPISRVVQELSKLEE